MYRVMHQEVVVVRPLAREKSKLVAIDSKLEVFAREEETLISEAEGVFRFHSEPRLNSYTAVAQSNCFLVFLQVVVIVGREFRCYRLNLLKPMSAY